MDVDSSSMEHHFQTYKTSFHITRTCLTGILYFLYKGTYMMGNDYFECEFTACVLFIRPPIWMNSPMNW